MKGKMHSRKRQSSNEYGMVGLLKCFDASLHQMIFKKLLGCCTIITHLARPASKEVKGKENGTTNNSQGKIKLKTDDILMGFSISKVKEGERNVCAYVNWRCKKFKEVGETSLQARSTEMHFPPPSVLVISFNPLSFLLGEGLSLTKPKTFRMNRLFVRLSLWNHDRRKVFCSRSVMGHRKTLVRVICQ